MKQFTVTISDPCGLHARPAGQLVKAVAAYKSRVLVEKNGKTADSRRLIAIMALCIQQDETIKVTVEGEDEECAAQALQNFFQFA